MKVIDLRPYNFENTCAAFFHYSLFFIDYYKWNHKVFIKTTQYTDFEVFLSLSSGHVSLTVESPMSEEFAIIIKLKKFATEEFAKWIFTNCRRNLIDVDDERKHNGKYIVFDSRMWLTVSCCEHLLQHSIGVNNNDQAALWENKWNWYFAPSPTKPLDGPVSI